MADSSLKVKTIQSLFWKLFEQGGTAVATLVIQVVMARILDPDEFGALAIMLVFVNVGNVVVQSGLNTALIQSPDTTDRDCSTVFWMSLALSLLMYVIVFVVAPFIGDFYGMPALVWPLRALVLVLVVNAFNSVQEAIVARDLEFKKTLRATVTAAFTSGAAGIAAALAGAGIWALVVQQLVQQLVKCLTLAVQISWRPALVFDFVRAGALLRFGWKLLASGLLDQGYQSLSDLVIGKLFTSTELGYVSQGKKYPQALGTLLDGAIQPVMLSAVSRVQSDTAAVKSLARRALKTSTFLIAPAMTLFAVAAEPLVTIVLGEKWLASVPFLQVYCFIYALLPIHTTNLQVLNGMGRSDLFLKLEVVKKIIGVSLLCFNAFVMRSLEAIVAGYVASGVVCTFVNASPNKRVIGYSYAEQIRDICPAFLLSAAAAIPALAVNALALPPFPTVLLQALVGAVVYLGLAKLLRIEELSYLIGTVKEMLAGRNANDATMG